MECVLRHSEHVALTQYGWKHGIPAPGSRKYTPGSLLKSLDGVNIASAEECSDRETPALRLVFAKSDTLPNPETA